MQLLSHFAEVGLPTHKAKTELEPGKLTCKTDRDRFYEMTVLTAIVYLQQDISAKFTSMYETAPLKNQTINHTSVRYNKDPGSTDKIRYKLHLLIHWPLFYAERNHNIHWPERVRMPQTEPAAERPFVTGNNPPPTSNQIIDSLTQQLTAHDSFFVFICNFRNILPKM